MLTFLFLGVKAQVQLVVHLDNIVKIITRTLTSLDFHPSLTSVRDDFSQTVNNLHGTTHSSNYQ
jgi:hypothetical protein